MGQACKGQLGVHGAQKFPHLTEAIFDKLDNKKLAACRKVSRSWLIHLDQQKFFKIRIIISDIEKFHKVGEEWSRFLRGTNTEMINRLGLVIKKSLMGNGRKQILTSQVS